MIGVPDELYGEKMYRFVTTSAPALTGAEILRACRPLIGTAKLPSAVHVIAEMPLNAPETSRRKPCANAAPAASAAGLRLCPRRCARAGRRKRRRQPDRPPCNRNCAGTRTRTPVRCRGIAEIYLPPRGASAHSRSQYSSEQSLRAGYWLILAILLLGRPNSSASSFSSSETVRPLLFNKARTIAVPVGAREQQEREQREQKTRPHHGRCGECKHRTSGRRNLRGSDDAVVARPSRNAITFRPRRR